MTSTAPNRFVRAYLRASTSEQDATRAQSSIEAFAKERGLTICNYYIENESGSRLERPELFQFLANCPATTIVMEACRGAHFMVRKLTELGHCAMLCFNKYGHFDKAQHPRRSH